MHEKTILTGVLLLVWGWSVETSLSATAADANAPVPIRDWHDLGALQGQRTGSYILKNDLSEKTTGYAEVAGPDANEGKGFQPIGRSYIHSFQGHFDGGGYRIRGLHIVREDTNHVGLFGFIGPNGRVERVHIEEARVQGRRDVGALAGENLGVVTRVSASGSVSGLEIVGGLVGCQDGILTNAYSTATVSGSCCVGGLVGMNAGIITFSYSAGIVSAEVRSVGGLAGHPGYHHTGRVERSFWDRDVSGIDRSAGGRGLTTSDMSREDIFRTAGWDFGVWMVSGKGEYPTIK